MIKKFLLILVVFLSAPILYAGPYHSDTITPTSPPLQINIPANHTIRIINFVQDQASCQQSGNNLICNAGEVKVSIGNSATPVTVLQAVVVSAQEVHKDLFISGPASVSITPVPVANLFISFLRVNSPSN